MKAKIKKDEAAKRQVQASRLLQEGQKLSVIAKMVGAPRQKVYCWKKVLEAEGIDALRDMSKGERPALLDAEDLGQMGFPSQKPERRAQFPSALAAEN